MAGAQKGPERVSRSKKRITARYAVSHRWATQGNVFSWAPLRVATDDMVTIQRKAEEDRKRIIEDLGISPIAVISEVFRRDDTLGNFKPMGSARPLLTLRTVPGG